MKEAISLHIENLSFKAIIGVLPKERLTPQKLIIQAHITYIYDKKKDYLNYATLCENIQHYIQNSAYTLLESALIDIAHKLKEEFKDITSLKLCITKPEILAPCIISASLSKNFTS